MSEPYVAFVQGGGGGGPLANMVIAKSKLGTRLHTMHVLYSNVTLGNKVIITISAIIISANKPHYYMCCLTQHCAVIPQQNSVAQYLITF